MKNDTQIDGRKVLELNKVKNYIKTNYTANLVPIYLLNLPAMH